MQWFKHDTDASGDAKVRKLILRHGPVGYAIYFHCLELIASAITPDNITFELEHDSEIIADTLKVQGTSDKSAVDVVQEVMMTCINLGLFSEKDKRVFCFKLLQRLDSSMTSSPKLRKMITAAKENQTKVMTGSCHSHDGVMTGSCKNRIEVEENRKEKNPTTTLSTDSEEKGDTEKPKTRLSLEEVKKMYTATFHDLIPSALIIDRLKWMAETFDAETLISAFEGASSKKVTSINWITKRLNNILETQDADERMWREMGAA